MARLRWLHISDIHVGHGRFERHRLDQAEVFEALIRDAREMVRYGRPDVIFLTGDLAFSGQPNQYSETQAWLRKLLREIDAERARVYVVPGNHDVDWTRIDWSSSIIHEHVRQHPDELDNLLADEVAVSRVILPKLENYVAFCRSIDAPLINSDSLAWNDDFISDVGRICVVGLNSAILSQKNDAKGTMLLGERQLRLLREDPSGFLFLLVHHPQSWLSDNEANKLRSLLQNRPSILLCGHRHSVSPGTWHHLAAGSGLVVLESGALHNEEQSVQRHSYSWGELSDGRFLYRPRAFAIAGARARDFVADTDQSEDQSQRLDSNTLIASTLSKSLLERMKLTTLHNPPYDDNLPVELGGVPFFGRQKRLEELWQIYHDKSRVVCSITGAGGQGKTSLVRAFVRELSQKRSAHRIFAWSFRHAPSAEQSSSQFFDSALHYFGVSHRTSDLGQAYLALLDCIRSCRCLLVLDGLETLRLGVEREGPTKAPDLGMSNFLQSLRKLSSLENGGVVIVTSRHPIAELEEEASPGYHRIVLDGLGDRDGATLLRHLGVTGPTPNLEELSSRALGRPLKLLVLGRALAQLGGDVKRWPQVVGEHDLSSSELPLDAIEQHRQEAEVPEKIYLRLMALFKRPMRQEELDWLKNYTTLAKSVSLFTAENELEVRRNLIEAALMRPTEGVWSTHALVAQQVALETVAESATDWQNAHEVLLHYFEQKSERELPDDADSLGPLYDAVSHGCLAGRLKKALAIYRDRIARDNEGFSTEQLGLAARDLEALSGFFPDGIIWAPQASDEEANVLVPARDGELLDGFEVAWLLARISYCLYRERRVDEALRTRRMSNDLLSKLGRATEAAQGYEELSLLRLLSGNLAEAEKAAKTSVEWASKTDDKKRKAASSAILAATLHQRGDLARAKSLFEDAEEHYPRTEDRVSFLHSVPGARYCLFLLDAAKSDSDLVTVLSRANDMLEWSARRRRETERGEPLTEQLHHLVRGCVHLERGELPRAMDDLQLTVQETQTPVLPLEFRILANFKHAEIGLAELRAFKVQTGGPNIEAVADALLRPAFRSVDACNDLLREFAMPAQIVGVAVIRVKLMYQAIRLGILQLSAVDLAEAQDLVHRSRLLVDRHSLGLLRPDVYLISALAALAQGHRSEGDGHLENGRTSARRFGGLRLTRELAFVEEAFAS